MTTKHRRYYANHREEMLERSRAYRQTERGRAVVANLAAKRRADPEYRAQLYACQAVYRAVKSGRLIRPAACPSCGSTSSKVEAHHHRGYAVEHRLDVVWLCRACHDAEHHHDAD